MHRLTASKKRTWALLFTLEKVKGETGTELKPVQQARIKGRYRKQRGGIVNTQTLDVSTAQVSFAIDYRKTLMAIQQIEIAGAMYDVKDTTNVELENHTIIYDLELTK